MKRNYDNGLVLMDDYRRPIGLVESGISMNRFIGSGNKPFYIGEVGYNLSSNNVTSLAREAFFTRVKNASYSNRLDGALI